jgi:mRNA interferase RelE/StbE
MGGSRRPLTPGSCGQRMAYHIEFTSAAARQWRKLPANARSRIAPKIEEPAGDPRGHPASKPLVGRQDGMRLRVGDYRLLYHVDDDAILVSGCRRGASTSDLPPMTAPMRGAAGPVEHPPVAGPCPVRSPRSLGQHQAASRRRSTRFLASKKSCQESLCPPPHGMPRLPCLLHHQAPRPP